MSVEIITIYDRVLQSTKVIITDKERFPIPYVSYTVPDHVLLDEAFMYPYMTDLNYLLIRNWNRITGEALPLKWNPKKGFHFPEEEDEGRTAPRDDLASGTPAAGRQDQTLNGGPA